MLRPVASQYIYWMCMCIAGKQSFITFAIFFLTPAVKGQALKEWAESENKRETEKRAKAVQDGGGKNQEEVTTGEWEHL